MRATNRPSTKIHQLRTKNITTPTFHQKIADEVTRFIPLPSHYTLERLQTAAQIVFDKSLENNVHHPDFAPTDLDTGICQFTAREIASAFTAGLFAAKRENRDYSDDPFHAFDIHVSYLTDSTNAAQANCGIRDAVLDWLKEPHPAQPAINPALLPPACPTQSAK